MIAPLPRWSYLRVLGVRVDNVSSAQALAALAAFIQSGKPHHVVTVNPEFVIEARRDAEFHRVLDCADLAIPDGIGLLLAGRLLGRPLQQRVAGVDMVRAVAGLASRQRYRLYLLGAAPGVAEAAAAALCSEHPSLQIAGTYAGSPAREEEAEIVTRIRTARPHVLFVAYGAPRQDLWIARNLPRLGVPVAMGIGGALDFISGKASRAPAWAQRAGLEWLHRLLREPWRWRRMLALPRFAALVVWQRIAGRQG